MQTANRVTFPFSRLPVRLLRVVVLSVLSALLANHAAYAKAPMDVLIARQKVAEVGIGGKLRLTKTDGTKAEGYITALDADTVSMIVDGSRTPIAIPYGEIASVKHDGMPTAAKVGIGIGIGLVVLAGAFVIFLAEALK